MTCREATIRHKLINPKKLQMMIIATHKKKNAVIKKQTNPSKKSKMQLEKALSHI
jgi:hypothetical protein